MVGDIADDPEWPLTAPFSTFCTAFHIFITGVDRNFKLGTYIDRSKSQHADDKSSPKGAWPGSRDPF